MDAVEINNGQIAPSNYAIHANTVSVEIVTWTLEKAGFLKNSGSWYYQTISEITDYGGDAIELPNWFGCWRQWHIYGLDSRQARLS